MSRSLELSETTKQAPLSQNYANRLSSKEEESSFTPNPQPTHNQLQVLDQRLVSPWLLKRKHLLLALLQLLLVLQERRRVELLTASTRTRPTGPPSFLLPRFMRTSRRQARDDVMSFCNRESFPTRTWTMYEPFFWIFATFGNGSGIPSGLKSCTPSVTTRRISPYRFTMSSESIIIPKNKMPQQLNRRMLPWCKKSWLSHQMPSPFG